MLDRNTHKLAFSVSVALNKILIGLRWRQVLPPLILKGSWNEDYLKQLEKFVLTFASGIELGIY